MLVPSAFGGTFTKSAPKTTKRATTRDHNDHIIPDLFDVVYDTGGRDGLGGKPNGTSRVRSIVNRVVLTKIMASCVRLRQRVCSASMLSTTGRAFMHAATGARFITLRRAWTTGKPAHGYLSLIHIS